MTASLKTLSVKPSVTKPEQREKEYSKLTSCHKHEMVYNISMTSLNFRAISIHSINHDRI